MSRVALIDVDVLRYELGFSSEFVEDGVAIPREWEFVQELVDGKIASIIEESGSEEAILYLTKDRATASVMSRGRSEEFLPNFREEIAVSAPYKGTRKSSKPIHYKNITAYVLGKYNCVVADGLEADDLMAIEQTSRVESGRTRDSIICSRDKDLRQVPGYHYSWECGKQGSLGPLLASPGGKLKMRKDKVVGTGLSFFHYQLLVGDSVDNIPGARGWGLKKAYNLLQECTSPEDQFRKVRDIYNELYGGDADNYLREQGALLWLVRSFDSEGKLVMWDTDSHTTYVEELT